MFFTIEKCRLPFVLITMMVILIMTPSHRLHAQEPPVAEESDSSDGLEQDANEGATPIMQGPLHEAFAEQFSSDPEPSELVPEQPPEPINELPPELKPEGNDVQWVPGYWGWDVQANDYVWVSGIWRQTPPGQRWIPGYWAQADDGWQWVSGFWTSGDDSEITYLPEPPASVDNGPSDFSPEENAFWVAGSWHYDQGNYIWQSGSWKPSRADQMWVPDRYVWTPSGYIYRPGYWDYAMVDRGTLFCPVLFQAGYQQPYQPSYCVDIGPAWFASLFVAPGFSHYYYGSYYGYSGRHTLSPWLTYQQTSNRCDPMYSYYACQQRNVGWLQQLGGLQRQYQSNRRVHAGRPTVASYLQRCGVGLGGTNYTHLHVASVQTIAHGHAKNFNNPFSYHRLNPQAARDQQASVAPVRQFERQRRDHEHASNHHHNSHRIANVGTTQPSRNGTATAPPTSLRIKPTHNGGSQLPGFIDERRVFGGKGHHDVHHQAKVPTTAAMSAIRNMNMESRANRSRTQPTNPGASGRLNNSAGSQGTIGQGSGQRGAGNGFEHRGHSHHVDAQARNGASSNQSQTQQGQAGTAAANSNAIRQFEQRSRHMQDSNRSRGSAGQQTAGQAATQNGSVAGTSNPRRNGRSDRNPGAQGQRFGVPEHGAHHHAGNANGRMENRSRSGGINGGSVDSRNLSQGSNNGMGAFNRNNSTNPAGQSNTHRGHRSESGRAGTNSIPSAGGQAFGGMNHNRSTGRNEVRQASAQIQNQGMSRMPSVNVPANVFGGGVNATPSQSQAHHHHAQPAQASAGAINNPGGTHGQSHHHGGRR